MNTRVRKHAAERRREIFEAVFRIIGQRGVQSLTTTALAHEVGVTSGALFRHFASRDVILREAVDFALVKIEETFPPGHLPPNERLLRLARNRVRLFESDPGIAWLLRSEQAYLALPRDAADRLRDVVKRSADYLLDAIREGVDQSGIRSDIEPEVLLVLVMGTIHALVGMPGVHRLGGPTRWSSTDQVLAALQRMLAPERDKDRD